MRCWLCSPVIEHISPSHLSFLLGAKQKGRITLTPRKCLVLDTLSKEEAAKKVMVIDSDLEGSTGLKVIHQKHPEVFVPSGIMERGTFLTAAVYNATREVPAVLFTLWGITSRLCSKSASILKQSACYNADKNPHLPSLHYGWYRRDLLRDVKKPCQQVEEAFAEDQLDYVDLNLEDMNIAGLSRLPSPPENPPTPSPARSPTPPTQFLSKHLGCSIQIPRRFIDYLPGSAIPLAHMPIKQPLCCAPPQREPTPSESSDEDPLFIEPPPADPFQTDPDSMGLYQVYPAHPTFIPPNNTSLINLTDAPTLEG
ncbi:uncharacterized protein EDB91DRAFT_1083225 [Suillus paluster]|uniref:uncharacterized protein n=1 Tax=Suillus paluster TaxID=48578 RepID=UPI001B865B78|nr:uncharacterized protein EDB91DRAFT_1083225 [Suillus paluster]KAG1736869.1 hypothetical protein EDB91DRAFT_1083225 [Suillus paluster]